MGFNSFMKRDQTVRIIYSMPVLEMIRKYKNDGFIVRYSS